MNVEAKHGLQVSIGQYSNKGVKALNQDFHGCLIPENPQISTKGIAAVMADGISSSHVSQVASETVVKSFLHDYFCTADIWSVKKSVQCVLGAINSWLYAQTRRSEFRYNMDKGYVCTVAALIIKSRQAYLFHAGDTRIYRIQDNTVEPLTQDHRLVVSEETSYLSRGMGVSDRIDLDYQQLPLREDDTFILLTDGVHEYIQPASLKDMIHRADTLDEAARNIVDKALENGSQDNLSIQIVRVDNLPSEKSSEFKQQGLLLPLPPMLDTEKSFDGYQLLRKIHGNSRSHVYLAKNQESGENVVLKIPAQDSRDDVRCLERLMMEEWVARRLKSPHLMRAEQQNRKRNYLYTVTEYIEGQTLSQWLRDNPKPSLEKVRTIIEQVGKGLQALHRQEILHQDLKPDNVMIDASGTVKIIDYGAVRVAGVVEGEHDSNIDILGTALYAAPEYFIGDQPTFRSDIYSLGVLTYFMLSGRFPYGNNVAKCRTRSGQRKLTYQSVLCDENEIPRWLDETLKKAVRVDPYKRYGELSEFLFDLRHSAQTFLNQNRPPLIEQNPVKFWQTTSIVLAILLILQWL